MIVSRWTERGLEVVSADDYDDLQQRLAEVERERDWWHGNCAAEKVARQIRESERDTIQRENAELKGRLDELVSHGGFWGRACARLIDKRKAAERETQRLREALETLVNFGDGYTRSVAQQALAARQGEE